MILDVDLLKTHYKSGRFSMNIACRLIKLILEAVYLIIDTIQE